MKEVDPWLEGQNIPKLNTRSCQKLLHIFQLKPEINQSYLLLVLTETNKKEHQTDLWLANNLLAP